MKMDNELELVENKGFIFSSEVPNFLDKGLRSAKKQLHNLALRHEVEYIEFIDGKTRRRAYCEKGLFDVVWANKKR